MGYAATHGRYCALTIPTTHAGGDAQVNFPVLFCWTGSGASSNLPDEMFNADGSYPAKSDGSDVRFSSDEAGDTPLNVEIVSFSIDNDPANARAEIWVRIPSLSDSVTTPVYVWYNDPDATAVAADDVDEGSQGVWDSSFEAVWHMRSTASTDADHYTDSTANANHMDGTSMAISPTAGPWGSGYCAEFDGSADYLSVASAPVTNEPITLTAWTNSDTRDYVNQYVIDVRDNVASERWVLRTFNTEVQSGASHWGGLSTGSKTTVPTAGTWAYIGGVTSGAASRYAMLNGALGTENTTSVDVGTVDRVWVGEVFNGKIDEARISSVVRSTEWLLAEYTNGNTPEDITVGTPGTPSASGIVPILLQVAA